MALDEPSYSRWVSIQSLPPYSSLIILSRANRGAKTTVRVRGISNFIATLKFVSRISQTKTNNPNMQGN
jgi:hypothetical protein